MAEQGTEETSQGKGLQREERGIIACSGGYRWVVWWGRLKGEAIEGGVILWGNTAKWAAGKTGMSRYNFQEKWMIVVSRRADGLVFRLLQGGAAVAGREMQAGRKQEQRTRDRWCPGRHGGKWRINQRRGRPEKWEHEITHKEIIELVKHEGPFMVAVVAVV